eukprot:GFYU01002599.1.p1 GENE.GFYU01002599.1~~GFYU01002599.1.p1  ORF type:complete len:413 (+),score=126.13 GFYU01002599.1:143-1381(+)
MTSTNKSNNISLHLLVGIGLLALAALPLRAEASPTVFFPGDFGGFGSINWPRSSFFNGGHFDDHFANLGHIGLHPQFPMGFLQGWGNRFRSMDSVFGEHQRLIDALLNQESERQKIREQLAPPTNAGAAAPALADIKANPNADQLWEGVRQQLRNLGFNVECTENTPQATDETRPIGAAPSTAGVEAPKAEDKVATLERQLKEIQARQEKDRQDQLSRHRRELEQLQAAYTGQQTVTQPPATPSTEAPASTLSHRTADVPSVQQEGLGEKTPVPVAVDDTQSRRLATDDVKTEFRQELYARNIAPENLKVSLKTLPGDVQVLTVSGEKEETKGDEKSGSYYKTSSSFSRQFKLDSDVDTSRLAAKFDNGKLTITAPRIGQENTVKQIDIDASAPKELSGATNSDDTQRTIEF